MFRIMEVKCNKCEVIHDFARKWFKKNDITKYICRRCKIIQKTNDPNFKESQRQKSKQVFADINLRSRMSLIAQINNIEAAKKISKTLKRRFADPDARKAQSEIAKRLWQDDDYKRKISEGIKNKWSIPDYRRKIIERRQHKEIENLFKTLTKEEKSIKKYLDFNRIPYKLNHSIHIHEFVFFIDGKYLIDLESSRDKELFIQNYFPQYIIINSLSALRKNFSK